MSSISVSLPADGETIDAADYNTPINTIVNDYNGNIDNSNIAAAAAIAGTKLADNAITTAKIVDGAVTSEKQSATIAFSVYRNSAWTAMNTSTKISFDTESYDIGEDFDPTTNHRFVAPIDGIYHFDAMYTITELGAQTGWIALYKNGSRVKLGLSQKGQSSDGTHSFGVSADVKLVATDYIEVYQNVGITNKTGSTGADLTYFNGHFIGTA